MKKLLLLLAAILMVLSLLGCGAKQKIEEKIAEEIVEKTLGNNVDVDGDTVTVTGENGKEVTFQGGQNTGTTNGSGIEWPDSEMTKKIPEFTGGKVESAVNSEDYSMIFITEVDEQYLKDYMNDIIEQYCYNGYFMKGASDFSYTSTDKSGLIVSYSYTGEDKTLGIQISQGEAVEDTSDDSTAETFKSISKSVFINDFKWPEVSLTDDMPKLDAGAVDSITYGNNYLNIVVNEVEKKDFENYFETLKSSYANNGSEMKNEYTVFYSGENESGNMVSITYDYETKSVNVSVSHNGSMDGSQTGSM